ncbi:MAG: type II CAAX endopeptidase family protein [Pyrinomonadaceae bacterium]
MRSLFIDESGILRSGWRAAAFLVIFLFVSALMILGALAVIAQFPFGEGKGGFLPLIIPFALSAAIAIILGWLFGKKIDGVPFSALGCSFEKGWLKNLAFGSAVGAVAFGSAVLIAIMSGGMSLALNRASATSAIASTLATTLVIFAVGAASEETLFRGYLLQTFGRSNVIWIGVLFTSVLFALAHNNNPDATWFSWINTFIAGLWFAAAYLKTRDLWFPFGVHLAWNWLQGPVFGINVSGITEFSPDPILRATDAGPAWLTGGSYGLEGGLVCTIALLISIGTIYFLPQLKSEPPA